MFKFIPLNEQMGFFMICQEKCRPHVLKIIHSVTDDGVKTALETLELVTNFRPTFAAIKISMERFHSKLKYWYF